MLRLARQLLTAPIRSLFEWMSNRASRLRHRLRRVRRLSVPVKPSVILTLEPYESRSQIGTRAEAVVLGMAGIGLAALQEPILAMVQAVGQQPFISPTYSSNELSLANGGIDVRTPELANHSSGRFENSEVPESPAMGAREEAEKGAKSPDPQTEPENRVDPGLGTGEESDSPVPLMQPAPYPEVSHGGGGSDPSGSSGSPSGSSGAGGGGGGGGSELGNSPPLLSVGSSVPNSAASSGSAAVSQTATAGNAASIIAAPATHRTSTISVPHAAATLPSTPSFNQPLAVNAGTTRAPRTTQSPSPWQDFRPPLSFTTTSTGAAATSTSAHSPVSATPSGSHSSASVATAPSPNLVESRSRTTTVAVAPTSSSSRVGTSMASIPAITASPKPGASASRFDAVPEGIVGSFSMQPTSGSGSGMGSLIGTVEGGEFSGFVATFSAWGSGSSSGMGSGSGMDVYTANINWGDSKSSAGTVSGFSVSGSHTYLDEGSYTVTVTVSNGSSSKDVVVGAVVSDALLAPGSGASISVVEGTSFTGTVGAFFDGGPGPGNEGDSDATYAVAIDWGDKTTSAGTVSAGGTSGTYVVTGSHQYTEEGSYTVIASIVDDGGASATVYATATVSDAPLSAGAGESIAAVEGTSSDWNVGTFTDAWPEGAGDYAVLIDWGDTTGPSGGSVTQTGTNSYSVTGTHAFPEEGKFTVTATVIDHYQSAVVTGKAVVADAPLSPGAGEAITAIEGSWFAGKIATFSDPAPEGFGAYSVTIDWGIGAPTKGSVALVSPGGLFTVMGSFQYPEEGKYAVKVTIVDEGGASTVVTGTATVGDAPLFAGTGSVISAVEGRKYSGPIATFFDAWQGEPASDYTAIIQWGDGGVTYGTVAENATIPGTFVVDGEYTYTEETDLVGLDVAVTVIDHFNSTTIHALGIVSDAPLTGAVLPGVEGIEGQEFTATVATFTDTDTTIESAGNYTASIDWGDGSKSSGTIAAATGSEANTFTVSGTHKYLEENNYNVTVVAYDHGTSVAMSGTSKVDDAALTGGSVDFAAVEGENFTNRQVATFTDAGIGMVGDFTATINWGDGKTESGIVTGAGGTYAVAGSHRYVEEDDYLVTVTVNDDGGASATIAGTIAVTDAKLTKVSSASIEKKEQETYSGAVAIFLDPAPEPASHYVATIDWGDGFAPESGTVIGGLISGTFIVSGSHKYVEEEHYSVTVRVVDDKATVVIVGTATIDDAPLSSVSVASISKAEGETYDGPVGTFSDPAPEAAREYSVSINWGDASAPSPGTVRRIGGTNNYEVAGTHKFEEEGAFAVRVTVVDNFEDVVLVGSANIADAKLTAATAPVELPGVEKGTASGVLGQFTDAGIGSADDYTISIDWGDKTTTTGSVAAGSPPGTYVVSGSHQYDEEGTYAIRVHVVDHTESTELTATATVADARLSGSAKSVHVAEGDSFSGVIATFSDAAPESLGAYGATIDWGDGTSTTGTIGLGAGIGAFKVSGEHTYADEPEPGSSYSVTVRIADEGGASTTLTGTVQVDDAPLAALNPIAVVANPVSGDEGATLSYSATWTASGSEVPTDFSVVVTSVGGTLVGSPIVSGAGGNFTVSGQIKYDEEGSYRLNFAVSDALAGTNGTETTWALIEDAPLTDHVLADLQATANDPTSAHIVVARFTDAHSGDPIDDYSARIDWGDGTAEVGTVASDAGGLGGGLGTSNFKVTTQEPHTYRVPGKYVIHTHVLEDGWGSVDAYTTITVDPDDAGTLHLEGRPLLFGTEGKSTTALLAKFQAADNQTAFAALIDWGDGTGWLDGNVARVAFGTFGVTGTHTYPKYGSYYVRIEVEDGIRAGLLGTTAIIEDAAIDLSVSSLFAPTNRTLTNVVVGTIASPVDPIGDYAATIYWGDGGSSAGQLVSLGGKFLIYGSHEYVDPTSADQATTANLKLLVVVEAAGGAIGRKDALLATTHWMEGDSWPVGVPVLKFKDLRQGSEPDSGDFTATVTVDGSSSSGTVEVFGTNKYGVSPNGELPFEAVGDREIAVDVADEGGAALHYTRQLSIADAPLHDVSGSSFSGTVDTEITGITVAVFRDSAPHSKDETAEFTALVDWGDGENATASVRYDETVDRYFVDGDHTYHDAGHYTVNVEVWDADGMTLILTGSASIAEPDREYESPVGISALSQVRRNDPDRGDLTTFGDARIAMNTGGVRLAQALDFDLSPGTAAGGSPALVYNSSTAGAGPVIEAAILVPTDQVVTSIEAQLTWNEGDAEGWVTFPVTAQSTNGVYTIQLAHNRAVTATWLYHYQIDLRVHFADIDGGTGDPDAGGDDHDDVVATATVEGFDPVVVQKTSEFGAGWGLDGWSRVVATPDGILRVFGNGDFRVYGIDGGQDVAGEDFGNLQVVRDEDGDVLSYTYTDTHQDHWYYTAEGQLASIVDPHELTIAYTYNQGLFAQIGVPDGGIATFYQGVLPGPNEGLTIAIDEPGAGRTVQLDHSSGGRLASITDAEGFSRTFSYTDSLLTGDVWGPRDVSYSYGPGGGVTSIDRGGGVTLSITPAATSGVLSGSAILDVPYASTTTALSETAHSLLDANGRVWQRTAANGTHEAWNRNGVGDVVAYQDPDGFITEYSYDGAGDMTEVDAPDGAATTYSYDGTFHRMTAMVDGDENVTTYALNATGDVVSMTDPLLETTRYSWINGLLVSSTDPMWRTTYTTYDSRRRPTAVVQPEGDASYTTYDANGNVYSTADNYGNTYYSFHDRRNRLVGTLDPDLFSTSTLYDSPGDATRTVDAGGLVTDRIYDGRGILIVEKVGTNMSGGERDTIFVPNADGEIVRTVDPMNRGRVATYDSVGRVVTETVGQWLGSGFTGTVRVTGHAYDPNGNETLSVDPMGRGVKRIYDGLGRVVEEIGGKWSGIAFVGPVEMTDHYFDANGNVTLTVDPRDVATETEYDPDGRVWRVIVAEGTAVETVTDTLYNDDGLVTGTVSGVGTSAPELTRYLYDTDGRVTTTVDPMGRAQRTFYDLDGRVTARADGWQLAFAYQRWTTYTYDPDGRLSTTTDPTGHVVGAMYNEVGETTQTIEGLELPAAQRHVTSESYDPFWEEVLSTDALSRQTEFVRDADGEAIATIFGFELGPNGWKKQDADFNAFGEEDATLAETSNEREVVTYTNADGQPTLTIDGAELPLAQQRWTYSYYDGFGNLTLSVDPMGRATAWVYNADNQVVEQVEGYGSSIARASVTLYDDLGRVTATIAGFGTADAIESTTAYDPKGNVALTTDPMGRQTAYLYNLDNELTAIIEGFQLPVAFRRITTYEYDGFGENIATAEPNGRKLLSSFDKDGRLSASAVQALDALGTLRTRTNSTSFDAFGNAILTVDPLGRRRAATYDKDNEAVTVTVGTLRPESTTALRDHFGNVTLSVDSVGHQIATAFDFFNRPAVVTAGVELASSLWETFRSFYDDFGEQTLSIDPLGNEEEMLYDKDGEKTQDVTGYGTGDAESETDTFDALGEETAIVDAQGNVRAMAYDGLGRTIAQIVGYGTAAAESQLLFYNADSQVTGTITGSGSTASSVRNFYDAFGDLTGTIDGAGRARAMLYDLAGQLTATVDAPGTADENWNWETHDGFGDVVATTDGDGRTRSELADADGEVTVSFDPAGHATYRYYDEFGQQTLAVDPVGHANATFYDDGGRATLTIAGFGSAAATPTSTSYDNFGRVASTTDGDGRVQASFYDVDNHLTLSVAGFGSSNPQSTRFRYDENGNVTAVIDGLGNATVTAYDHLNRAVAVTDASGRANHSYYDAAGNLTGSADGLGHLTQHAFDDQGREVETIDPDTNVTLKYYDNDGHLTGVVDPDANLTQYLYNAAGEQTETIDPLGHASDTYYDDSGLVTRTVDRVGRRVDYLYQTDGLLTAMVWTASGGGSAGGKYYTYDAAGEMLTASNAAGTYSFSYDGAGRVNEVDGPFGVNLTFGYDGGGNRTSVSDNAGGLTTSTFDAVGRLSSRNISSVSGDARMDIGYDAAGRETVRTRTEGSTSAGETDRLYDAGGMITSLITNDASSTGLFAENYTYDGAGRLHTRTVFGVVTINYGYDAAGQLLTAGVDTYGYDPNGVPNTGGLTPGVNNRVSTDGSWTYTYDNAGELIEKSQGSASPTWWYQYDHDAHMTQATYSADGATVTAVVDYHYDVFGNLVGRSEIDGGSVVSDQRFVVDGWDTAKPGAMGIEKYDVYADLAPSGGSWSVTARRMFGAGFNEPVVSLTSLGAVSWYAADRQGSVTVIFDTSGSVLETLTFEPFGNLTAGTYVDRYGFQGGQWDSVAGLVHFGDRWFSPVTHQWTSEDSLGLSPDSDPRRFVGNKATNGTDPSGNYDPVDYANHMRLFGAPPGGWGSNQPVNQRPAPVYVDGHGYFDLKHRQQVDQSELGPDRGPKFGIRPDEWAGMSPLQRIQIIDQAAAPKEQIDQRRAGRSNPPDWFKGGYIDWDIKSHYQQKLILVNNPAGEGSVQQQEARDAILGAMKAETDVAELHRVIQLLERTKSKRNWLDDFGDWLDEPIGVSSDMPGILTDGGIIPYPGINPSDYAVSRKEMLMDQLGLALPNFGFGTKFGSKAAAARHVGAEQIARLTAEEIAAARVEVTRALTTASKSLPVAKAQADKAISLFTSQLETAEKVAARTGSTVKEVLANFGACFAAGTWLRTPDGSKMIQHFKPGDFLLSRDEHDSAGPVVPKLVEEVFTRAGQIWEVIVWGKSILASGEHPFYCGKRGWIQANELQRGDTILTMDGALALVESVVNTDRWEQVFNLRVSKFHTYFVGCDEWGFSIWAHNLTTCVTQEGGGWRVTTTDNLGKAIRSNLFTTEAEASLNAAANRVGIHDLKSISVDANGLASIPATQVEVLRRADLQLIADYLRAQGASSATLTTLVNNQKLGAALASKPATTMSSFLPTGTTGTSRLLSTQSFGSTKLWTFEITIKLK